MSDSKRQAFPLHAYTQSYDWGKLGSSSKAAQYANVATPGFVIDENKPYAELWMGTHKNLPSKVESGQTLSDYLDDNRDLLGSVKSVPFLFKVLAIRKALSIQTHPDADFAKALHEARPDVYRDPKHKPEMAIALTPFEALCGFQLLPSIAQNLSSTPELSSLLPSSVVSKFQSQPSVENLKPLFAALMTADAKQVADKVAKLVERYEVECKNQKKVDPNEADDARTRRLRRDLVLELQKQFPGDVGIFCVFFLNHMVLEEGQAIFLGAGTPHAYISGDIIECMAASDNVLRAGLTPKARDVPNLLASLNWAPSKAIPRSGLPYPTGSNPLRYTTEYQAPVDEFSVLKLELPEGGKTERHPELNGPSIFIVTEGEGELTGGLDMRLQEGSVVFVGATTEVTFKSSPKKGLTLYRAYAEY